MADAKPHCRLVDLPTWCRQHRPGLSKKRRALLPKRVITTKPEPGPAAPGGVIGNGGCQLALSTWGLAHVVAMAPSGPIQNASRAPLKRVIAATPESARAAPGGVIGKDGCQLALSTCGFSHVVATAPSGPTQNASIAPTKRVRVARPESPLAARETVIGNGECQLALSTSGFAQVVPTALSGPIQNASSAVAGASRRNCPSDGAPLAVTRKSK